MADFVTMPEELPWDQAMIMAANLGGRIPKRHELLKMIDEGFDFKSGLWVWTSSKVMHMPNMVWVVYLLDGYTHYGEKDLPRSTLVLF